MNERRFVGIPCCYTGFSEKGGISWIKGWQQVTIDIVSCQGLTPPLLTTSLASSFQPLPMPGQVDPGMTYPPGRRSPSIAVPLPLPASP
jgi:hypothetical protein